MGLFKLVGSFLGGNAQKKGAKKASKLEYDAAMAGLAETARQFDKTEANFAPAQALLGPAAGKLGNLVGINGDEALAGEIASLKESPLYQSLYRSGEDAVLANASATGGLRGGNTQLSLAEFGEDTLSQLIQQQISNYGGLVDIGTGAAGQVGGFGAQSVAQQAALRNQGAGAKAQYQLVKGGINAANFNNAGSFLDDAIASILGGGGGGSGGGGFSFKNLFA